ncbi:MAG: hypothetical protein ACUVYA_05835, partial [Planctomycetota bacterium]
ASNARPATARTKEHEGPDPKVAALAAHRLLQDLASSAGSSAETQALKSYVFRKLDPRELAEPGTDTVVAERLADAMATWIVASGPPFPEAPQVLLPLAGVGPPSLRDAVVRALQALVRHELSKGGESSALRALLLKLAQDPSRSVAFVRDAARIVWDADGKALLETLVAAVANSGDAGAPPAAVVRASLDELRARIRRDFPNAEGWQKWWKENRELPLESILAACWSRDREELVAAWKGAVRRLRETGNADRLLAALQDALASSYVPELRVAVVLALGDFAEWVAEMRFEGSGEAPEAAKEKLLRRAAQLLLPIAAPPAGSGKEYVERREVSRAALAALGKHRALFEKDPALLGEASRIVLGKLAELESAPESRGELVEALRLAGALRLEASREFVTRLVARFLESSPLPSLANAPQAGGPSGVEVLTAAVSALGRLLEKSGVAEADCELLLRCFRAPSGEGGDAAGRELRRACVAALGSGSGTEAVRAKLLAFHRDLLAPEAGDGDLRIPAILALGTLARQGTAGALEALFAVLDKQAEFQPQEVVAAIDSIAYVGGEPALAGFLARVSASAREKRVYDHLLRKTAALVGTGGIGTLAVALEKIDELALSKETAAYAEFASALLQEPSVQAVVAACRQSAGGDGRLGLLWRSILAAARLDDLLGKEKEVAGHLAALDDLAGRVPSFQEKYAAEAQALAAFRESLAARASVRAAWEKGGAESDAGGTIEAAKKLVVGAPSPALRWSNLRWFLRQIETSPSSPRIEALREGWYEALAADPAGDLWKGIPPAARERYLARLDALKGAAKPEREEPRSP